ncbi:MAG: hypothetical protein NTZ09_02115 [Candidatus Hydrogenedentes bacterium]|nr:hypothetical protein [Candidatus Hydrogenedentota bacterium]
MAVAHVGRLGVSLFLLIAGAAFGAADAPTVVAVEWLPQSAHGKILQAYEGAADPAWPKLRRVSVMGDEKELQDTLRGLPQADSTIIVSFGQTVADEAVELCPGSRHVVLFAPESPAGPNVIHIKTEPAPESVWRVAADLKPGLKRLGMLYTARHTPNEQLAAGIEIVGKEAGRLVVRATVPHGLCRTESDFEKAMDSLEAAGGCDVLYVPDDPNTSRFAPTLFRLAGDTPVMGGEATRGRGCSAAFVRDYQALGRALAGVVAALAKGEAPDATLLVVAPQIVRQQEGPECAKPDMARSR